jgi:hypothetical protein
VIYLTTDGRLFQLFTAIFYIFGAKLLREPLPDYDGYAMSLVKHQVDWQNTLCWCFHAEYGKPHRFVLYLLILSTRHFFVCRQVESQLLMGVRSMLHIVKMLRHQSGFYQVF